MGAEQKVLDALKNHRVEQGDWFGLSVEEVIETMKRVTRRG